MNSKLAERFATIYTSCIEREGADRLMNWLENSDFFDAPASTRFHGAHESGLVEHSLNVYDRLVQLVDALMPENKRPSNETIAIVSLLHDLCKVNFYTVEMRNRKNEVTGQWEKVPVYAIDDQLPYGHGEKSVYIISGFIKLSREEAMAIRWHMGGFDETTRPLSAAWEKFPLGVLLHCADLTASYFDEAR